MAATNISTAKNKIIDLLKKDYPNFMFHEGAEEHWSPKTNTIFFDPKRQCSGVLHELAHALLKHSNYKTDFELLKLESEAWELAVELGKKYNVSIDEEHVQNCLDTYRDWLHRRCTCPSCGTHVLQKSTQSYQCHNCQTTWHVSSGRVVRAYRKTL
jgi:hypothetical protein